MTSQELLLSNHGIWGRPSSAAGQEVPSVGRVWVRVAWPGVSPRGRRLMAALAVLAWNSDSHPERQGHPDLLCAHAAEEETEA